jgi:hypothetical protein
MRRYKKTNHSNRVITANFPSVCAETGNKIPKGELCLYYPAVKKVFCLESDTYQDWAEIQFDNSLGYNY